MTSRTFNYTGAEQSFVVPYYVTAMTVDMAGAQGGLDSTGGNHSGRGGRVQATFTVTPGETIRLRVGGKPATPSGPTPGGIGGFYGGANGASGSVVSGGGGGGASDIRLGGTADANRKLVAGGGGGGANNGAHQPEWDGGPSLDTEATTASTATDGITAGNGMGGGGGGWRGGLGGDNSPPVEAERGGRGGTNMAHSTQTSGVTSTAGYQVGDGYVTLTWTDQTAGSRTFPAPVHTSATQYSGADLRTLTTTDPAAEVSTTIRASAITGRSGYFRPNQTDGVAQAVLGYGQAKKWGWVFNPVGPIVPSNTTAWILSGGNFTVPLHHSRPGGLGTGDVNNTFTVLFFRMSSDLTTVKHELGRVTGAQVATTTTEQVQTLTVPLDSSYFEPGDLILMEIHQVQAGAITVDNVRVHTGSATATRISAGPLYTIKYVRAQAHTVTPTDAQYRKLTSRRQHDEATSVVQSQTRRVTYPRKHEKTVPAPVAAQVRSVVAHRLHPESAPVADQQYRRIETHRLHDEDTLVAQVQHRRLEMHRRHDQTVPTPVDTQQRKLIARRRHDEAVPTPADTQSRSLVLHRSHAEDAAVVQTQLRRATYRRRHDEALSEGGAQTPYPDGLLRLRPDGRIEAVNANIGALPPGALRITTAA